MVKGLFAASCLLSLVSWYTTQQGMALYLSVWFSLLASLGVQAALVLVAWLIGFTKSRRGLLIAVYAITATVSVAFSYVALHTWFSARERPAAAQRKLYDRLSDATGKTQALVTSALGESRKHALALEEMTAAEKAHGYISRSQDADPYLDKVRTAVGREAQTYDSAYKDGPGTGLRYTAFDRYTKLARESSARLEAAERSLGAFRAELKPLDSTESQLRIFRQTYDAIPWADVEEATHTARVEKPAVPAYADFVDHSASGQEDLILAFEELLTAPTGRHVFSFALAAFIDVIVFLLAFASGPYFSGSAEQRWVAASAAIDAVDAQVFVSGFLRKLVPGLRGMARVDSRALTPGEQQLCLLFAAKKMAVADETTDGVFYLIDQEAHENLLESLGTQGFPLRAGVSRAMV